MCTVSIVPGSGQHIFTFNRDEKLQRHTKDFINHQLFPHKHIYFAQDAAAGGTWFGADDKGNVIMLFNGAFNRHVKVNAYRKSRGIILLEILASVNMLLYFKVLVLDDIEPFSVILFENKKCYRLTWDGAQKHVQPIPDKTAHIFSSATLYDDAVQQKRQQWLQAYLLEHKNFDAGAMYNFHSTCNISDVLNGLIINRPGSCSTLSISQAVVSEGGTVLKHTDLQTGKTYSQSIVHS
jgi:uncharacterized protein with NRDE domain